MGWMVPLGERGERRPLPRTSSKQSPSCARDRAATIHQRCRASDKGRVIGRGVQRWPRQPRQRDDALKRMRVGHEDQDRAVLFLSRYMPVSTAPGSTAFTRTPCGPNSAARVGIELGLDVYDHFDDPPNERERSLPTRSGRSYRRHIEWPKSGARPHGDRLLPSALTGSSQ
jgi:hypothetical protein